jgi:hypothetical protein
MPKPTYYRYLHPTMADHCIGKIDYTIWYYSDDEVGRSGRLCTDLSSRPSTAFAAVVATFDPNFTEGEELFAVNFVSDKDPLPPPPPPPGIIWSKPQYLAQESVQQFARGLARTMSTP